METPKTQQTGVYWFLAVIFRLLTTFANIVLLFLRTMFPPAAFPPLPSLLSGGRQDWLAYCASLVTLLLLHSNSHLSLSQLYFAVLFQKLFFYQKVNIIFWSSLQQIDTNLKAPISCKRSNRTNIPKSNNWTIAYLVVQGCLFVQNTEIIFVTSSACVKLLSLG